MRSERQRGSARLTLLLGGVGVEESGSAFTTYGCERVDGITSHRIQLHQLSESLNELERQVEILEFKYLEVLDTLTTAMAHLVKLLPFIIDKDITKC